MADWVIPLADEAAQDAEVAGSKGATLAKMISARFRVPDGFVVTTEAFEQVVRSRVNPGRYLRGLDPSNHRQLQAASDRICKAIQRQKMPSRLTSAVRVAYRAIGRNAVSVRSSSTAEDLENASFAGQYESFLNVRNAIDVM